MTNVDTPAMPPSEVRINVRCHCRNTSFSLELPETVFPLKSALCHCNSCRHATGHLFATFAFIPTPVPAEIRANGSGNLAEYRSSSTLSRLHCKKCGASIANVDTAGAQEEWELTTGSMEFADDPKGHDGKLNRVQLWVEDVKGDGGAATWVNAGTLSGMDRHWTGRDSSSVSDEDLKKLTEPPSRNTDSKLSVRCHCRNISFDISQPEKDHNHGTGRFEANLDACTSCRLVTGLEITSWATVPQNLIQTDAPDIDTYLSDRSKLMHYKTSPDVSRYFCTICGANIFYLKHGLDTIDIGIGVLDPGVSGEARIESWLLWQKPPQSVVFQEDAVDGKFVTNLVEGFRLHQA